MMLRRNGKVLLSIREFEALPDYSCTIPTGTTLGKQWRRREPYGTTGPHRFWMGEYVTSLTPGMVGIEWTEIELPPDYTPPELRRTVAAT